MSSHSEKPRHLPQQERGERRVKGLLVGASLVLAEVGYEAATMSEIAERAGASIGSLYQFFPNKLSVAQALRLENMKAFEKLLIPLEDRAREMSLAALVTHLLKVSVNFVDTHPEFLALLDAPASSRLPAAMRRPVQERVARILLAKKPRLLQEKVMRLAAVTLQILKAMCELYLESQPRLRKALVQEFKAVLLCYLSARMELEESNA